MDLDTAARKHWDVVIVGSGMGGATVGYALAQKGRSVLFLERGKNLLANDRLAGAYAEMIASEKDTPLSDILPETGRWTSPLHDRSMRLEKTFIPFIGMGSGGSSSLYGAALERFFPEDFEPGKHHNSKNASTLPPTWPISYEEMRSWYVAAERLYQVYGTTDPLRAGHLDPLADYPPLDTANQMIATHLKSKGLHPYRVPGACLEKENCRDCQGFLCATSGKRDSASVCLAPALAEHNAALVDECEVIGVEAGQQTIHRLACIKQGKEIKIDGDLFIFAAGALHTPALMLRSISRQWPKGLANGSAMVGRNLMRHAIDLYLVKLPRPVQRYRKQLAFNDFYLTDKGKLGSVQSFGTLPPLPMLLDGLHKDISHAVPLLSSFFPIMKPFLKPIIQIMTSGKAVFAGILEDLPYADNRIEPHQDKLELYYRLSQYDQQRLRLFRRHIQAAFAPWKVKRLNQAENNERIAHVCGTCRFGDDPDSSVLDRWNKAHELDNLYITDASFFPSSGGINPALTIAANALRVADHIINR